MGVRVKRNSRTRAQELATTQEHKALIYLTQIDGMRRLCGIERLGGVQSMYGCLL
jgi:hypothetical protein